MHSLKELLASGDYYAAIDAAERVLFDDHSSSEARAISRYIVCSAASKLRAADTAFLKATQLANDGDLERNGLVDLIGPLNQIIIEAALRSGRADEAETWVRKSLSGATLQARLATLCDPSSALGYLLEAERLSDKPGRKLRIDIIDALVERGDFSEAARRALALRDTRKNVSSNLLVQASVAAAEGRYDLWTAQVSQAFGGALNVHVPTKGGAIWRSFSPANSRKVPYGPLVNVVMTTHNSARTVSDAIRSVVEQTYENIALTVVDDRSSDETRAIVERWTNQDSRLRLLTNKVNVGTYVAKNNALKELSGEYVTFHDSDDYMLPSRIESHVRFMEDDPSLVASTSEWIRLSETGYFQRVGGAHFNHPNPASMFVRLEAFREIGFFDAVRVGGDSEFGWRLRRHFGVDRVKAIPEILGLGLASPTSLTGNSATGYDRHKYSAVRLAYGEAWVAWHRSTNDLFLEHPLRERKFPAPPEIAVTSGSS